MATSTQKSMIGWMFVLVLFISAITGFTMLEPPAELKHKDGPLRTASVQIAGRGPASVNASSTPEFLGLHTKVIDQTADFKVPCKGETYFKFDQNIRQIRLTGEICQAHKKQQVGTSEIHNDSNGFVATVFQSATGHFTTDYISLEKGTNHILVTHRLASGQVERKEYVLERAN